MLESADYNASHDVIYSLPQLGGGNFSRPSRFFPSLQLGPPMVPTRTLRGISARTRSLASDEAEIEVLRSNVRNRSLGCGCLRCVAARVQIDRPPHPISIYIQMWELSRFD